MDTEQASNNFGIYRQHSGKEVLLSSYGGWWIRTSEFWRIFNSSWSVKLWPIQEKDFKQRHELLLPEEYLT